MYNEKNVANAKQAAGEVSISYLLALPPIRRVVLQYISAFDAAKLDSLLLCVLTKPERTKYLKPFRDLVWNVPEMEKLSREGMKLTVLGDDVHALEQRLHATERYLEFHGNRRLTIYLMGTFPIVTRAATGLDGLVNFSTTGDSSPMRSFSDKYHLKRIRASMEPGADRIFLMSFGAPMRLSTTSSKGSWCKVEDVPDNTVDLWVYVPSFGDRLREEVRMTPSDILRMSQASARPTLRLWRKTQESRLGTCGGKSLTNNLFKILPNCSETVMTLSGLLKIGVGRYRLQKWSLTSLGVQSFTSTPLVQLLETEGAANGLPLDFGVPAPGMPSSPSSVTRATQAPKVKFFLEVSYCNVFYSAIKLV